MNKKSEIYILTGTPGAGKTTVAKHLLQQYEFGLHIPIDDLREWVVSGIAHPLPVWTDETTRQFALGYQATACMANIYARAGFTVVIDQVIYPWDAREHLESQFSEHTVYKVFLQPGVETARKRNATRTNKDFDTHFLDEPIQTIYKSLSDAIRHDADWVIIDSTNLTLDQTVEEILRQTRDKSVETHGKRA